LSNTGDSIIHRYLIAALALLGAGNVVHAATPDLVGTHWYATDDGCVFDEVMFAGDGTADLYDALNDETDTVSWSLEGTSLTMAFIDENDGVIAGAVSPGRIEVVHTWRALKTKKVHQDACVLEPE
jgi:hypothetical protein